LPECTRATSPNLKACISRTACLPLPSDQIRQLQLCTLCKSSLTAVMCLGWHTYSNTNAMRCMHGRDVRPRCHKYGGRPPWHAVTAHDAAVIHLTPPHGLGFLSALRLDAWWQTSAWWPFYTKHQQPNSKTVEKHAWQGEPHQSTLLQHEGLSQQKHGRWGLQSSCGGAPGTDQQRDFPRKGERAKDIGLYQRGGVKGATSCCRRLASAGGWHGTAAACSRWKGWVLYG
jgi:hypothetical protein